MLLHTEQQSLFDGNLQQTKMTATTAAPFSHWEQRQAGSGEGKPQRKKHFSHHPRTPLHRFMSLTNDRLSAEIIAAFGAQDFDEAQYIAAALVQSSSGTLEQLSTVLAEIDAEVHRQVVTHHEGLIAQTGDLAALEARIAGVAGRSAACCFS